MELDKVICLQSAFCRRAVLYVWFSNTNQPVPGIELPTVSCFLFHFCLIRSHVRGLVGGLAAGPYIILDVIVTLDVFGLLVISLLS